MSSYIIRASNVYLTVEPIFNKSEANADPFGIGWCWTTEQAAAVRFTTRWHALAVARRMRSNGSSARAVRVKQ